MSKDFLAWVYDWWSNLEAFGYAGFKLFKNLQYLRLKLKEWNKEEFGLTEYYKKLIGEFERWDHKRSQGVGI